MIISMDWRYKHNLLYCQHCYKLFTDKDTHHRYCNKCWTIKRQLKAEAFNKKPSNSLENWVIKK